jgi:hypothetical protein
MIVSRRRLKRNHFKYNTSFKNTAFLKRRSPAACQGRNA